VFAVAQVLGAASGGHDLARPLAHLRGGAVQQAESAELKFQPIASLADLDAAVRSSTRPVMLDFYADWCVACKEFEKFTFTDEAVRQKMAGLTLLRVDVTANNENDKALLRKYTLFGPRVIGFQNASTFGAHLDRIDAMTGSRVGMK